MKFIVLGALGMLGSDLTQVLIKRGHDVVAFSSQQCDITSRSSITAALMPHIESCDMVLNCAAYTQVDNCEIQPKKAFEVNAGGVGYLVDFTTLFNVTLVHFSTDYVFNGKKKYPYNEHDIPDPISVYGESKLEGESAIVEHKSNYYIFRVQWLYGQFGGHFIQTILNLAKDKEELSIVNDQWGSPSSTLDISRCLESFLTQKTTPAFGVYHIANQGYTTWFDLASYVLSLTQSTCRVIPTTSDQFKRPAARPQNGRLNCDKFLSASGAHPLEWKEAVREYLTITHLIKGDINDNCVGK